MNKKGKIFKEEPGFLPLFRLFKEKYRSIGRIGGNVSLASFTDREVESIAGFLGQPKEKLLAKGNLSLLTFEKELSKTGFSEYTLFTLLEEVLEERILTKKEELEREKQQEKQYFAVIEEECSELTWWLQHIQGKTSDTRWIYSLYKGDAFGLKEKMLIVCKAFIERPTDGEFERLPVFAQKITGNPHYFDTNEAAGKLLLHCLFVHQKLGGDSEQAGMFPKSTEERNDLLAEYGLIRDDLWNFVTCQGLFAASSKHSIHPVWKSAVEEQTVLNIPMKELAKLTEAWPVTGNKVWIVENSSVCSTIMDAMPNAPIICTHGQLRAASWLLLDLLTASDCTLSYSGDLDPEGILIANRLKKRYEDQVVIWRMDTETYQRSISNEDITDRLVKLDKLTSLEWKDLITRMKEYKMAGYQEAVVGELIRDIKENINE